MNSFNVSCCSDSKQAHSNQLPVHDRLLIKYQPIPAELLLISTRSATGVCIILAKLYSNTTEWTRSTACLFQWCCSPFSNHCCSFCFVFLKLINRRWTFPAGWAEGTSRLFGLKKIFRLTQLHYGYVCCKNAEIFGFVFGLNVWESVSGKCSNLTESELSFYLFDSRSFENLFFFMADILPDIHLLLKYIFPSVTLGSSTVQAPLSDTQWKLIHYVLTTSHSADILQETKYGGIYNFITFWFIRFWLNLPFQFIYFICLGPCREYINLEEKIL